MNRQEYIEKHFKCIDCGINTHDIKEYYMVKNEIWFGLKLNRSGMLCIGCLENRLGRRLKPNDFPDLPINTNPFNEHSERLKERLKGIEYVSNN